MRIDRITASSTADHAEVATRRSARVDRSTDRRATRAGGASAASLGKLRTPWNGTKRVTGAPGAWNGPRRLAAQAVLPALSVAMKRASIVAAHGFHQPVTWWAFATLTKVTRGNRRVSALACRSGIRSSSLFSTSAGTLGNRACSGNGGFGRRGAGQEMQASPAGSIVIGCCLTNVVHAPGENGAVARAGSPARAEAY